MIKILIQTFCILFFSCIAQAQPKDFYEHDFSKRPLEETQGSFSEEKTIKDKASTSNPKSVESSKDSNNSITESFSPGTKIQSIGVVLDSENKKHFEETLWHLKELAVKHEFPVGEITAWGGFPEGMDEKLITTLFILQAELNVAFEPADTYSITQSPTWVLKTQDGVILLEGINKIDRFFNKKGDFIDQR
ncbi:MAG: hypothetical protein KDD56_09065 [Bdellovibrionales bacterium]|nr:hypothetical protein [Bdellovibrionales bacterium]